MDDKSINCIVETPKGLGVKYDYNPELAGIELSKILPAGLVFPFDFGHIPGTIGEDGDPLDVVIISEIASFPGCAIKCRIIGGIKAIQKEKDGDKMRNDRYIAIPSVSVLYKDVTKISQLPEEIMQQLQAFFINYNEQAGKKFKPLDIINTHDSLKLIDDARQQPKPTTLVQLLLPLYDNNGTLFPKKYYEAVKAKLIEDFGGVTAYSQAPASGLWQEQNESIVKDKIIVYEVMVGRIDRSYWKKFKGHLQEQFQQQELIIRQTAIGLL